MPDFERTYVDILNELKASVGTDNIPLQQKSVIEEQIDILVNLLWKWSA